MSGIETNLVEMADRLPERDKLLVLRAVALIQEFREANDRLRRENDALRLDVHFYDKEKNNA